MTVADLLNTKNDLFFHDKMLKCDLVALEGKTGKVIFDTKKNKKEFIQQFFTGKVISLWADVRLRKGHGFNDYFEPIMKCYVSHRSWERKEQE